MTQPSFYILVVLACQIINISSIHPVLRLPVAVGLISLQILSFHTAVKRCVCFRSASCRKVSEIRGRHKPEECICMCLLNIKSHFCFISSCCEPHYEYLCFAVSFTSLAPSVGQSGYCWLHLPVTPHTHTVIPSLSLVKYYIVFCYFQPEHFWIYNKT